MPRRTRTRNRSWRNCDIPLRWQIFGGAIFIVAFMHLAQLATEALVGERVPQRTEQVSRANKASRIFYNDILYQAGDDAYHDHDELPSMHLLMEPIFNNNNITAMARPEPIAIAVNMTLNVAKGRFAPGRPLLTLPLLIGTVPSARYDEASNPLRAYNRQGQPIPLSYRDEDPVAGPRVWFVREDASFDSDDNDNDDDEGRSKDAEQVLVSFTAPYNRQTDPSTGAGTRLVGLGRDVSGGGLMGQGLGFLPIPPPPPHDPSSSEGVDQLPVDGGGGVPGGREQTWNVTLVWHLAHAPVGTHGAWSLGDADHVTVLGPLDRLISHAIFAVGYLQRFPAWDVDVDVDGNLSPTTPASPVQALTYWFDPSPLNMTALAHHTLASYTRLAAFFHTTAPLRVLLVRRIGTGWGGTGATQSFLLEYADEEGETTTTTTQDDAAHNTLLRLAELLAHETVHEFALLDPVNIDQDEKDDDKNHVVEGHQHHHDHDNPSSSSSLWQEDEGTWYVEGVASYVGALVGLNGRNSHSDSNSDQRRNVRTEMIQMLNNMMQAYYTAPRRVQAMNYGEVLATFWQSPVDVVRVPHTRGFVLLAQLDGMISHATEGQASLDTVILALYQLRMVQGQGGKPCTVRDLQSMVAELVGPAAWDRVYAAFFRGELIVPAADCLARHGLRLVARRDWRRFELGFETDSLRTSVVAGLVKGSNADKVGVREGDSIVRASKLWIVEDSLDGKMKMTVLRDGEEVDLEWSPRSDEVVEAYGWVEIDGQDPDEL